MKNKGDFNKKDAKKSADKKGAPAKSENSAAAGFKSDREKYEARMKKTLEVMESEFSTIRAGRANPAVLDRISVEYYGTATPLAQVASISSPEPRVLVIQPWDASLVKPIEKAILTSDLGINPANDGRVIRLIFPPLTEERRRDLTRQVKKLVEDSKVAIRNVRRDAVDDLKKQQKKSLITEDDLAIAEKDVQELTDRYVKLLEDSAAKKEKELMEV